MKIHIRKLKDATLTKVKTGYGIDAYHLCLVYEEKDSLGNLHKITLKDVPLPLCDNFTIIEHYEPGKVGKAVIDVGYGDVDAFRWNTYSKMTDTIVEYAPPKEMTLEEIEEKLGYKVKIVSGEED